MKKMQKVWISIFLAIIMMRFYSANSRINIINYWGIKV